MGSREPEIDPSSDVAFNEDSILCRNQQKIVGKKVSFEITTDGVEGPSHRTKLALRQTTEENIARDPPPLFSPRKKDPLDELSSTRRFTRGTSNRVEMTQSPRKVKVPKDRTELNKATNPLLINPEEGE